MVKLFFLVFFIARHFFASEFIGNNFDDVKQYIDFSNIKNLASCIKIGDDVYLSILHVFKPSIHSHAAPKVNLQTKLQPLVNAEILDTPLQLKTSIKPCTIFCHKNEKNYIVEKKDNFYTVKNVVHLLKIVNNSEKKDSLNNDFAMLIFTAKEVTLYDENMFFSQQDFSSNAEINLLFNTKLFFSMPLVHNSCVMNIYDCTWMLNEVLLSVDLEQNIVMANNLNGGSGMSGGVLTTVEGKILGIIATGEPFHSFFFRFSTPPDESLFQGVGYYKLDERTYNFQFRTVILFRMVTKEQILGALDYFKSHS